MTFEIIVLALCPFRVGEFEATLEHAGMTISRMDYPGQWSGRIDEDRLPALRELPCVASAELAPSDDEGPE